MMHHQHGTILDNAPKLEIWNKTSLSHPFVLNAILSKRSSSADYALGLLITLISFGLSRICEALLGGPIYIWSLSGAIVAAIILGRGPAILCAIFSTIGLEIWVMSNHRAITESTSHYNIALRLILSFVLTLMISRVASILRQGYLRSEYLQKEAEKQALARQQVVDIVSHDLRNPLASVHLYTTLLLNNLKAPVGKINEVDQLNGILRSVERMRVITSDLLDVSQIEMGHFSVQPTDEELSLLIHDLLSAFSKAAKEKNIIFDVNLFAPQVRCRVDRTRIIQALSNLVHNAIKYSPSNGVIQITAEKKQNEISISISDSGPGINPDKREHIFERYWTERNDVNAGTGLGLFISKGIAVSHGGDLFVSNQPSGGARFTLTIPLSLQKENSCSIA